MATSSSCTYCELEHRQPAPVGGWILAGERWLVQHGPPETSTAGTLKIISRRHYTDFHQQTHQEAASFGVLLARLDAAARQLTGAERVHLLSTRDRVEHFHAWLYPRPADSQLRGTDYLAAPQSCQPQHAADYAQRYRALLTSQ